MRDVLIYYSNGRIANKYRMDGFNDGLRFSHPRFNRNSGMADLGSTNGIMYGNYTILITGDKQKCRVQEKEEQKN